MSADLDALVASPWWRWMPGMLATGSGWFGEARLVEVDNDGDPCLWMYRGYACGPAASSSSADTSSWVAPEARPVITDPATLGCLLALAREAWGDPTLHAAPGGSPGDAERGIWWEVRGAKRRWYTGSYPTEADALIAAILAAPPPGVGRG